MLSIYNVSQLILSMRMSLTYSDSNQQSKVFSKLWIYIKGHEMHINMHDIMAYFSMRLLGFSQIDFKEQPQLGKFILNCS